MLLIDRKMPKSCGDCVCNNDNFLCNITYDEFDGDMWERRMPNCPLKEDERKTGKWIRNDNGTYSCSLCQSWIPEEQYYYARFCLCCGADMRGEEDG